MYVVFIPKGVPTFGFCAENITTNAHRLTTITNILLSEFLRNSYVLDGPYQYSLHLFYFILFYPPADG